MDVEQRARELLAAEYRKAGANPAACELMAGRASWPNQMALNAIIAALTPPEGWVAAADRELVAAEIGVAKTDDSTDVASAKLRALIDWHVSVATDPAVNGGYVLVPVEPTPGLLMSMAIRGDHALGCPGYYDQEMFKAAGHVSHHRTLEVAISEARKQHEEVVGAGFYSPEREAGYAAMLSARPEVKP